jgi:hypothetical protein
MDSLPSIVDMDEGRLNIVEFECEPIEDEEPDPIVGIGPPCSVHGVGEIV